MKKYMVSVGIFLSVLWLTTACATLPWITADAPVSTTSTITSDISLLVQEDWLKEHLNSPNIRIIDFGRNTEDYHAGHIPGAVYVDRATVWDEMNGIAGMLPLVDTMVAGLEKAGIGNNSTVVIYDDAGGLWASRLFWALEYLGHREVHVLNGGFTHWMRKGHSVQTETPGVAKANFIPRIQPNRLTSKAWIMENLHNSRIQVVDSRSSNEYIGEDVRSAHGGHIPGAANINWIDHLDEGDAKTVLPEEMLAEVYASQDISKDKTVVTYCQTGVRGAHAYFVLRLLGYPDVRVYDGSWAEWGNDEQTPKVAGSELFSN